jgi:hypothetical protein
MTAGKEGAARHRCHRLAARCDSLQTIASLVTRERQPRVWSVRPRTVANIDSLG